MGPVEACIHRNVKISPASKFSLDENARSSFTYVQDYVPARIFNVRLIADFATHLW